MSDAGQRARRIADDALRAARDRYVSEITFVYEGIRYSVSDLRRLQAAGQLNTLPRPLAAGVPYMLQEVDRAEAHGEKRLCFNVYQGDPDLIGWMVCMPIECDVLLPDGWERLPGKGYLFREE